jgi:hypothetical protein
MNQLPQINVSTLLGFAQQFDKNLTNNSLTNALPQNDKLLEIFHTYNAHDFYTKAPKLYAGTTKCCATGTCMAPPIFN